MAYEDVVEVYCLRLSVARRQVEPLEEPGVVAFPHRRQLTTYAEDVALIEMVWTNSGKYKKSNRNSKVGCGLPIRVALARNYVWRQMDAARPLRHLPRYRRNAATLATRASATMGARRGES